MPLFNWIEARQSSSACHVVSKDAAYAVPASTTRQRAALSTAYKMKQSSKPCWMNSGPKTLVFIPAVQSNRIYTWNRRCGHAHHNIRYAHTAPGLHEHVMYKRTSCDVAGHCFIFAYVCICVCPTVMYVCMYARISKLRNWIHLLMLLQLKLFLHKKTRYDIMFYFKICFLCVLCHVMRWCVMLCYDMIYDIVWYDMYAHMYVW